MTVAPFNTGRKIVQKPEWSRQYEKYQQDCVGKSTDLPATEGDDIAAAPGWIYFS